MGDNELFALIIEIIDAQKSVINLPDLEVLQNYQPLQQGALSGPAAYLAKLPGDRRYGSPYRNDTWNADDEIMVHTETQQYESTFQLEALVTQNPETPELPTASDVANRLAYALQSDYAIDTFNAANVGLLRVTDIRNLPFKNDRDQFQFAPSFDFVLTHKQTFVTESPVVTIYDADVIPV